MLAERAEQELAALAEWVRCLVPVYIVNLGHRNHWCIRWWEHPSAVARLHALWLAYGRN